MQSTRLWIPVVPRMVWVLMLASAWGERGIVAEAVATCRVAGMAMRSLMGFSILRLRVAMGFRDG